MNNSSPSITGIAEVSLRVHDLGLMRNFYEQVIGLEVLRENEESAGKVVFYSVGAGGQNLALFEESLTGWFTRDKSPEIEPKGTTLSHIAFDISLDEFESQRKRIEHHGIEIVESRTLRWMRSRMFYFFDPEGNLIEFKSRDETVQ